MLARELGLQLEMPDVECESLLPPALSDWQPDTAEGAPSIAEQLVAALRPYDDELKAKVDKAAEDDLVPVHVGTVDTTTGETSAKLQYMPKPPIPTSSPPQHCNTRHSTLQATIANFADGADGGL